MQTFTARPWPVSLSCQAESLHQDSRGGNEVTNLVDGTRVFTLSGVPQVVPVGWKDTVSDGPYIPDLMIRG